MEHGVGRQQHEAVALQPDERVEAWVEWGWGKGGPLVWGVTASRVSINRPNGRTLRGRGDEEEQQGQELQQRRGGRGSSQAGAAAAEGGHWGGGG